MTTSIASYLETLEQLLEREHKHEQDESHLLLSKCPPRQLERAGLALLGLAITETKTGLGGQRLISLERPLAWHASINLPAHQFKPGDLVALEAHGSDTEKRSLEESLTGVVYRVEDVKIIVAFDADTDVDVPHQVRLLLMINTATHKRLLKTLKKLKELTEEPENLSDLLKVCLGQQRPSAPVPEESPLIFKNPLLDESQKRAVQFALEAREIALIHGPPGTGKTHTLVEIIRHLVEREKRILVCGPSNISVDNIVDRCSAYLKPGQMTRIGHIARVLPSVVASTLDAQSQSEFHGGHLLNDIRQEIDGLNNKLAAPKSGKGLRGRERKESWREIGLLRKEFRSRESKVTRQIVHNAKVVLTTCHGAGGRQLSEFIGDEQFDVVIIDEAAQATEPQCWIPILAGKRLIIAGDPLQLPPTIKSQSSSRTAMHPNKSQSFPYLPRPSSLSYTMFDRLLDTFGDEIKVMLEIQYRMNKSIMRFSSDALYQGRLEASALVKDRLLSELQGVEENEDTSIPLVFFDTSGSDMFETSDADRPTKITDMDSKANTNEALLAVKHLRSLLLSGCKPQEIAIITPYSAQTALLRSMVPRSLISLQLNTGQTSQIDLSLIEIGTVDSFQGREKEAVILTLVRSNEEGKVGFLAERRRLNVAMTRAKRQCVIIGDSTTLKRARGASKDEAKFLQEWMTSLENETMCETRFPDLEGAVTF